MNIRKLLALVAGLALSTAALADVKISNLPAGGAIAGTEPLPTVQVGVTVKTTPAALWTYSLSQLTSANVISKWSGTCNVSTFLRADGACAAAGANPAGSDTQVQYNNAGAFAGNSSFVFNQGSSVLTLGTTLVPGTFAVGSLDSMTISGVAMAVPAFAMNSNTQGNLELHSYSTTAAAGPNMYGARSRGSLASPAAVSNGDNLLTLAGAGYDGTNYTWGAHIHFLADGTPSAGVMPGAIDFQTTPSGSNTPVSRVFIDHTGLTTFKGGVVGTGATGGDQGAGTGNFTGLFVNGVAVSAGSITQTTGTGTLSYVDACTTTPTQNYAYVLTGQTVTLTFTSQFTCTSDSANMISDALPSGIRPARAQVFSVMAQNNSGVVSACFKIDTTGVLTWWQLTSGQCAQGTAWTASGTKGPLTLIGTSPFIASQSAFTYTLN